jgi:flagellar hook-length control protein FliK
MPITIVSALPSSASPSTANAIAGAENALQDFTSLLLGHLTDTRSGEGLTLEAVPESAANDPVGGNAEAGDPLAMLAALVQASLEQQGKADDENTESGDSLALLAALTQASLGQRGKIASDESIANDSASGNPDDENAEADDSSALLATLAQASLEQRDKVASDAMMGNKSSSATGAGVNAQASSADKNSLAAAQMQTPANESAAKFAVSSDKIASTTQEPPGLSNVSTLAAGVPSRQDSASPTIPVPTSVYNRDWNNDFAQKVTWVATHNKQFAELTLNPPSMGNIEISLKLDNDKSTATATFFSSNAEVRESIETSLPRLREMLAGAGIQLGQTQVGAESFRQASGNGQHPGKSASPSGDDMDILATDLQAAQIAASVIGAGRGLVDMFA